MDYINEMKFKYLIRNKKKIKKQICPADNMKVLNGKCVMMPVGERIKRHKAQLKAAKKKKAKMSRILMKRQKSMNLRQKLSLFTGEK